MAWMASHLLNPVLVLVLVGGPVLAQQGSPEEQAPRVCPGITPPKAIHRVEPEYSEEARHAGVQGMVILQTVIDTSGRPTRITVLRPLGFGLDEKARAAVEQWRFEPATKDGKPVYVWADVEVNFRLRGRGFDEKTEKRRAAYNLAIADLGGRDLKRAKAAAAKIQELARQEYAPAMYSLGKMHKSGQYVAKDPEAALALIAKAADKNHAPAMHEVGLAYTEGSGVPRDVEKGLRLLRGASMLGCVQSQYYLGLEYETGGLVLRDAEQARHYFRLCAASGQMLCQFHLARLLLELPEPQGRNHIEAIAWFQLAGEQGHAEARQIADAETAKLTPEQLDRIQKLKPKLVHKP
jgi:TonB family protein